MSSSISPVQPLTIAECRALSVHLDGSIDSWTHERLDRTVEAGVPEEGRMWLDIIADDIVETDDGMALPEVRFEWHATWMWGPAHHPMKATGRGATEPEAFDALIAALG